MAFRVQEKCSQKKWEYWNDYSPEGIEQFASKHPTIHESAESEDNESEREGAESEGSMETEYDTYGIVSSVLVEEEGSQELIPAVAGNTTRRFEDGD
jgi:hypothetical protein